MNSDSSATFRIWAQTCGVILMLVGDTLIHTATRGRVRISMVVSVGADVRKHG